jgi:hypothetical protein
MRPRAAQVFEKRGVGAGLFERVGKDEQAVGVQFAGGQEAFVEGGSGQGHNRRGKPGGVDGEAVERVEDVA